MVECWDRFDVDDFPIGCLVLVSADGVDVHFDFEGEVIGYKDGWFQVRDMDDDVFDCDPSQLTLSAE